MKSERQEKMFKLAQELLGLMSEELKDSMKEQVENHHYEMAMNCLEDGNAFTDKCISLMRKTQDMSEIMYFLDERKWIDQNVSKEDDNGAKRGYHLSADEVDEKIAAFKRALVIAGLDTGGEGC